MNVLEKYKLSERARKHIEEYRNKLLNYLYELKKRDFLVIPVTGIADSVDKAKQPQVPRGFKYTIDYRPMELTDITIEKVRKGEALAFGIPGINNLLVWLDLEAKFVKVVGLPKILKLFPTDQVYVEKSATGGLHIGLVLDQEVKIVGAKGLMDNKTHGYVITHPSELFVIRRDGKVEVYTYEKISQVELWETAPISKFVKSVRKLVDYLLDIAEPEELEERLDIQEIDIAKVLAEERKVEYRRVPEEIAQIVSSLPLDVALAYVLLVSSTCKCYECLRYYIEQLVENEPWEVPNMTYPCQVQRGLHYVLEVEILGTCWLLGFSEEQLYQLAERIRYTANGEPYTCETPPTKTAEIIVRYNTPTISFRGLCPLYVANKITGRPYNRNCTSTLTKKISGIISTNMKSIVKTLEFVIENLLEDNRND